MSVSVSIQTETPLLSDKRFAERFQMTKIIMCHEREMLLKLNFFQLMGRYRSWGSVLISIKKEKTKQNKQTNKQTKTEMHMRQSNKKEEENACVRV